MYMVFFCQCYVSVHYVHSQYTVSTLLCTPLNLSIVQNVQKGVQIFHLLLLQLEKSCWLLSMSMLNCGS